jgi:flagellar hook-associated protein 1 FlgK
MANGFGSLYVGSSGLRTSQNGLNVIANNLSNIDTKGYVRQQVIFQDMSYNFFVNASVSAQYTGLGGSI